MHKEKRRSHRRKMKYNAHLIIEGNAPRGCILSDISDNGARIDVETVDELPDRFTLLLSGNGSPQRHCRVIWRQPTQVGVDFGRRLSADLQTELVPQMDEDFPAEGTDATPAKQP